MAYIYYQKRVRGIDVFQVGKHQIWDWCGWSVSGPTYGNHVLGCNSYSLAKGMYVVVTQRCIQDADAQAVRAAGGCVQDSIYGILQPGNNPVEKPQVWDASRSCGGAVNFALEIIASENTEMVGVRAEVWHIVDDGDLWQEWDAMSECAAITHEGVTCLQDVWQLQDGYIPTWMDPIIENVKGQSIRDYSYEPVKCSICGDDEFGPWVRLDVPFLGMRYFCECCEEEASRHGARYVEA